MTMETVEITESNKPAILELFKKDIDSGGYIIEKDTSRRLVCPFSNENIKADDFSVLPGSAIFVNNYYYCFAEYVAKNRNR
jgi:hypothetical protein